MGAQPITAERWRRGCGTLAAPKCGDRSLKKLNVREQVRELAVAAGAVLAVVVLREPIGCCRGFGVALVAVGVALVYM